MTQIAVTEQTEQGAEQHELDVEPVGQNDYLAAAAMELGTEEHKLSLGWGSAEHGEDWEYVDCRSCDRTFSTSLVDGEPLNKICRTCAACP